MLLISRHFSIFNPKNTKISRLSHSQNIYKILQIAFRVCGKTPGNGIKPVCMLSRVQTGLIHTLGRMRKNLQNLSIFGFFRIIFNRFKNLQKMMHQMMHHFLFNPKLINRNLLNIIHRNN